MTKIAIFRKNRGFLVKNEQIDRGISDGIENPLSKGVFYK